MRIDRVSLGVTPQGQHRSRPHERAGATDNGRQSDEAVGAAQAVVATTRHDRRADRARLATIRPDAGFIAHLIATHLDTPQTRDRRRAPLPDAIAAYGAGPVRLPPAAASDIA